MPDLQGRTGAGTGTAQAPMLALADSFGAFDTTYNHSIDTPDGALKKADRNPFDHCSLHLFAIGSHRNPRLGFQGVQSDSSKSAKEICRTPDSVICPTSKPLFHRAISLILVRSAVHQRTPPRPLGAAVCDQLFVPRSC
jgi:hypothetical protein